MRDYTYRNIPFLLTMSTIAGRPVQQFGWIFLCIGAIFSSFFLKNADISFRSFGDGTKVVDGEITGYEGTSIKINKATVKEYFYKFKDESGEFLNGVSYTTRGYSLGRKIKVEYNPATGWSRAEGMTSKPLGPEILFILIFPFVGFMLVAVPMFLSRKRVRLLKSGVLTTGEMCGKEPTNMRINNRTVYKYTFKFTDSRGKDHFHTEKTHYTHMVEDDHLERILYLPEFPEVACLVDIIGSHLDFDQNGNFVGYSFGKALATLIVPAVSIAAILVAAAAMS